MELVKVIKQSQIIKYVFFALIGTILLAISSKIKIPFYPVPMTMQTFIYWNCLWLEIGCIYYFALPI